MPVSNDFAMIRLEIQICGVQDITTQCDRPSERIRRFPAATGFDFVAADITYPYLNSYQTGDP